MEHPTKLDDLVADLGSSLVILTDILIPELKEATKKTLAEAEKAYDLFEKLEREVLPNSFQE